YVIYVVVATRPNSHPNLDAVSVRAPTIATEPKLLIGTVASVVLAQRPSIPNVRRFVVRVIEPYLKLVNVVGSLISDHNVSMLRLGPRRHRHRHCEQCRHCEQDKRLELSHLHASRLIHGSLSPCYQAETAVTVIVPGRTYIDLTLPLQCHYKPQALRH